MKIETLIARARQLGASDLHLEPGLAPAYRVRGKLQSQGSPVSPAEAAGLVRQLVGEAGWQAFREQRSRDLARNVGGVRCRINALHSMRGVGLAVRLLPGNVPTIETLNLHPELAALSRHEHGLVLISGPTGSGKTSTQAAMLEEINQSAARHIVTVEQPIEYALRPRRAFIRQREVGRDTPSFEQALRDALREDPDVIMVGELREPETIRLTLNAAETGHLVLATLHAATVVEALQRVVLAFAPEIQGSVAAQLADSLCAVVCQRLRYREDLELRVPECEILTGSSGARALVRQREFHKLASVLDTGAGDGMWSWDRYRRWLDGRVDWLRPGTDPGTDPEPFSAGPDAAAPGEVFVATTVPQVGRPGAGDEGGGAADSLLDEPTVRISPPLPSAIATKLAEEPVLVIDEDDDAASILAALEKHKEDA